MSWGTNRHDAKAAKDMVVSYLSEAATTGDIGMSCKVLGVHHVNASEPCYLIEVELSDADSFDWSQVTQRDDSQPPENWQVAYDEQQVSDDNLRWAFFFHYLRPDQPLDTADGEVALPAISPRPSHLEGIEYWPP